MISYFQAIVIGLLQGVTELFPVSSLGHSVLLPALLGWHQVVASQSARESFYLAFLVGLHVATALALLWFYRDQWARIVAGLVRSLRTRRIETADERLGWLLVVASIPAGRRWHRPSRQAPPPPTAAPRDAPPSFRASASGTRC